MTFGVPLVSLIWTGDKDELWPISLLEYPISAFRIAAEVYKKLRPDERIVASVGLFGIEGWKLRPYSPRFPRFSSRKPGVFEESKDLVFELELTAGQIEQEPDRSGYRFIERVYEAFGYRREQIPEQFDQKTGRLILPE